MSPGRGAAPDRESGAGDNFNGDHDQAAKRNGTGQSTSDARTTGLTDAVALLQLLAPCIHLGDGQRLGWVHLDLDTCTVQWGGSDPITRHAHAARRVAVDAEKARSR